MSRKALAIAVATAFGLIALVPPAESARVSHPTRVIVVPKKVETTPRRTTLTLSKRTRDVSLRRTKLVLKDKIYRTRTPDSKIKHPRKPGKTIVVTNPGGDGPVPPKKPPPVRYPPERHPPEHHHPGIGIVVVPIIGIPPVVTVPGTPIVSVPPTGGVSSTSPTATPGGNPNPAGPVIRVGFDVPPADEVRYRPAEVLLDTAASPASLDAIARRHRLSRLESYQIRLTGRTMHRLHIEDGRSVPAVIRALAGDPRIVAAQPNYLFKLQDEARPVAAPASGDLLQYVVAKLHLAEAHTLATGDRILVAVIDTGIDASHPYLAGAIAETFNPLGGEPTAQAHGTSMAGAIADHGELTGVAPRARLLSVRAFATGTDTEATTMAIIQGIDWAVSRGARVVNMSFAGPRSPAVEPVIAAAHKRGVVLVAASGNDGPQSRPEYPAADPHVIAVTATDSDDKLFAHATRGTHIAVAAPGVDVVAPIPGDGVEPVTGTSIAAAHVSGLVALMLELKPTLGPEDIRRILKATAIKPGAGPDAAELGAGVIDALAAITALGPKTAVSESSTH